MQLSREARYVYLGLRGLANGRTGALAIKGNPLDWRYICKQLEIGRYTWLWVRKDLIAAGLLSENRLRVIRFKDGRKREVLGETTYYVHKQPLAPKTDKKPRILLKSDSPNKGESDPQSFKDTLTGRGQSVSGVSLLEKAEKGRGKNHHLLLQPQEPDDDVVPTPEKTLVGQAEEILMRGEDEDHRPYVQRALEIVETRAFNLGKKPVTPAYYVAGYHNVRESKKDWEVVLWDVDTQNAYHHRTIVNALIMKAVAESKRTGRDVIDIFHELRQDRSCYQRLASEIKSPATGGITP